MIPFNKTTRKPVTNEELSKIYDILKTPKKIGSVVKLEGHMTDSPTVFKHGDMFYMYYIAISNNYGDSGYETHLSKSVDLINWEYVGTIFRRNNLNRWDSRQCAGYAAFPDIEFGGTNELQMVNGSYYISYLAGNSDGYEPDPLYMGLAKTKDATDPDGFTRLPEPILKPEDEDGREHETKTLYKSYMFEDKLECTGYKYVNAYNAKSKNGGERIFLAVSNDGEKWERYGDRPVIDTITGNSGEYINGDPQIVKIGDVYVMLFFRFNSSGPAFNTFAASRDLINWNMWEGEPLIKSEYEWECTHAHKPYIIRHNGRNYHFYCAVNKTERFIALAVSK